MPTEAPAQTPAADPAFFAQGIPVEVNKIQRELKKLWQDSHETATRASRLNLVIYSAAQTSIRANTALVEKVTRQHALRAILIAVKPQKAETRVRAWVNAHCQVSKNGQKQRCSEQIAIQLEGEARQMGLASNLIFSHLDSDLPLYLWRQGEFSGTPSAELMAWVDCLIFDSADWADPGTQFGIVTRMARDADLENGLADLNWTRLKELRFVIAQFFDAPEAVEALAELESVEIVHAPGSRTQALLLAGWLGVQLGWRTTGGSPWRAAGFQAADGRSVAVTFREEEGARIGKVELCTGGRGCFTVNREAGSAFYNTSACCGSEGAREQSRVLPVGPETLDELVSAELVHGGGHRAYLKVVGLVSGWL